MQIQRPRTTQQAITEPLRNMILQSQLAPGVCIDQDRTATMLGVSRMPVRESLRILATEDRVAIRPHQGATVAQLSAEEIDDL